MSDMSVEAKAQKVRRQIANLRYNIEQYKEEILDLRDRYRKVWVNWDSTSEAIEQAEGTLEELVAREGDPKLNWKTLREGIDNG